jgi:hypothetical protein
MRRSGSPYRDRLMCRGTFARDATSLLSRIARLTIAIALAILVWTYFARWRNVAFARLRDGAQVPPRWRRALRWERSKRSLVNEVLVAPAFARWEKTQPAKGFV